MANTDELAFFLCFVALWTPAGIALFDPFLDGGDSTHEAGGTGEASSSPEPPFSRALCATWLVITLALSYPLVCQLECAGTGDLFGAWVLFTISRLVVSCFGSIAKHFRSKRIKFLVLLRRTYCSGARLLQRFNVSCRNRHEHVGETDVRTVSVFLPSGAPVLAGYQVRPHDYVVMLRDAVEAKLTPRGRTCRLLLESRRLQDEARFCDVGLVEGSCITAVIVNDNVAEEVCASEQSPPRQGAVWSARGFWDRVGIVSYLTVFGGIWAYGEVAGILKLEDALLGCNLWPWEASDVR